LIGAAENVRAKCCAKRAQIGSASLALKAERGAELRAILLNPQPEIAPPPVMRWPLAAVAQEGEEAMTMSLGARASPQASPL
jgi:hypothetical protein